MGREIERKFLLVGDEWRAGEPGVRLRQGYLSLDPDRTVRVRIRDSSAVMTVKGASSGLSRLEFEFPIPRTDAEEMLDQLCVGPIIEKCRYCRPGPDGLMWEIDEFGGLNRGLVIAEVELSREDQDVDLPAWIGDEVSSDPRYFNAALTSMPYSRWEPDS